MRCTGANGAQLTQDPRNLLGLTGKRESLNTKTGMGYNRTGGEEGVPRPYPEWAEDRRPGQNRDISGDASGTALPTLWHLERKCPRIQPISKKVMGNPELTTTKFLPFLLSKAKYKFG